MQRHDCRDEPGHVCTEVRSKEWAQKISVDAEVDFYDEKFIRI